MTGLTLPIKRDELKTEYFISIWNLKIRKVRVRGGGNLSSLYVLFVVQ